MMFNNINGDIKNPAGFHEVKILIMQFPHLTPTVSHTLTPAPPAEIALTVASTADDLGARSDDSTLLAVNGK